MTDPKPRQRLDPSTQYEVWRTVRGIDRFVQWFTDAESAERYAELCREDLPAEHIQFTVIKATTTRERP